jgi:hypothetical protein
VAECFANLEYKVADTQLLGPEYTQAMSPAKRAAQSKVMAMIRPELPLGKRAGSVLRAD